MAMKRIDAAFYPCWTRKAITFTIDDGNIAMDRRLLDIVKPAGIKGTFNLCSNINLRLSAEELRAFYDGYEIANHCKNHPYAFSDGVNYKLSKDKLDEKNADETVAYMTDVDGIYMTMLYGRWRGACDKEYYCRYADEGRAELEAIFGEGSIRSFVWPYGEQNNSGVTEHLKAQGYYGIRKTGCLEDSTSFAPPADWNAWSYNTDHAGLLRVADMYERYPDDGELKFFSFGVHSVDFETFGKWDDLCEFARKYGSRPNEFYYATVGDIYDYIKALEMAVITENSIENRSEIPLYVKIDGVKTVLSPGQSVTL